jgi:IS5 family transposase
MKEEGMEFLLQETLVVASEAKLLKSKDLEDVIVDTTVQEKNITFPTDTRLLNRARETLVRMAKKEGIPLRQTYEKEAKYLMLKYAGYSHAKQFKRAKKPLRRLKTILGCMIRHIERVCKNPDILEGKELKIARKILLQKKTGKDKIYSIHEPNVECLAKGKAHKRYEFGCKVSVMSTNRSNWIIGAKALHGRPYDGHTVPDVLTQAHRITGRLPRFVYADKGYRGSSPPAGVCVFLSGQKRGVGARRKKLIKRRSAIEPLIGHLKRGHRMGRNFLKGLEGDRNNPILAAAGLNMAKLLAAFFIFRMHADFFLQNPLFLELFSRIPV